MKRFLFLASLLLAALLGLAPAAQAQTQTGYYCAGGATGSYTSGGSFDSGGGGYIGCPISTAPAVSAAGACAAITPTGTGGGTHGPWLNMGYGGGACQFRSYRAGDSGHACSPNCEGATVVFATETISQVGVHVLFIFTPAGQTYVESPTGLNTNMGAVVSSQLAALATANTASAVNVKFFNAGIVNYTTLTCCGTNTHFKNNGGSDQGAVYWALNDSGVQGARNTAGADLVIIYGNYSSDDLVTAGDSSTPLPNLHYSMAGVNLDHITDTANQYRTAQAVGRLMGAHNQTSGGLLNDTTPGLAHGWYQKTGTTTSNCDAWFTLDTYGIDNVIPVYTTEYYFSPTGVFNFISGAPWESASPIPTTLPTGDFLTTSAACAAITPSSTTFPDHAAWMNLGVISGVCQLRSYHVADTGFLCSPNCEAVAVVPDSHPVQTSSFTCPSVTGNRGIFSNPDIHYSGGTVLGGDFTKANDAGVLNANGYPVSQYHNTPLP